MLGLGLGSSSARKVKWIKTFLQHIKSYKKTGVKLREAQLISPDGELMAQDGEETMTQNDVLVSGSNRTYKLLNMCLVGGYFWSVSTVPV